MQATSLATVESADAGGTLMPSGRPNRRLRRRLRRSLRRVLWGTRLLMSAFVLVGVLAIVASIPLINIYVLGYMLEAEGRVGRGERWRNVLPWLRYAPRIAAMAFGTMLVLLPVVVLADLAHDAALIDPTGTRARTLERVTFVIGGFAALHLCLAYVRGGGLSTYVRPLKNARVAMGSVRAGMLGRITVDRLCATFTEFQFRTLFWTGARGLVVAIVWLFVPCVLIASSGPADGPRLLIKIAGAGLLAVVFPLLLIQQAAFATELRLRSGFQIRQAIRHFGRAPMAWVMAATVTAVLSLPLFLFKIVAPPRDAIWMLTPLFVAAMLPARMVTGWAYRRASQRELRRNLASVVGSTLTVFVVGLVYSAGVFAAMYINEHGRQAVFEQHAFSLPVPF